MEKERKESPARRKIMDTARDLFYRNGIRATGIDAVIEAADVARMTLYKHFPSKDALIDAVLQETADQLGASLLALVNDETLTPRGRVLAIFDWQAKSFQCDQYRGCPFMNAMAESPDHESPGYSVALRSKAMVRDEVALAVAKLGVADPDLLTEQLCLLLDGAASRAQLGFTCSAVTAARTAAELLMDTALAAG